VIEIIQTRITSSRLMSNPKLQLNTKTSSSGKIYHLYKITKPRPFDSSPRNHYPLASAASKGTQTHTKSKISWYNKNPLGPRIHLILADGDGTHENQKTTRTIAIQIYLPQIPFDIPQGSPHTRSSPATNPWKPTP